MRAIKVLDELPRAAPWAGCTFRFFAFGDTGLRLLRRRLAG